MTTKDCSTCRYAKTDKRPKVMGETGFDDQLMFEDADKDEVVYSCQAFFRPGDPDTFSSHSETVPRCKHAGKEIGLVPITCEAYAEPVKDLLRLSELDRRIVEREARAKAKGERE